MAIRGAQKDRAAKGLAPSGFIIDTTLSEYNYLVTSTDDESKKRIYLTRLRKQKGKHDV